MKPKRPTTALDRLEDLLAFRLPQSGKQLSSIVLTRADAEEILAIIFMLQRRIAELNE